MFTRVAYGSCHRRGQRSYEDGPNKAVDFESAVCLSRMGISGGVMNFILDASDK